jgi:hypothetical protein
MMMNFLSHYWHSVIVTAVLLILLVDFVYRFILSARRLSRDLEASISALTDIKSRAVGQIVDLDEIAKRAMPSDALAHLWREYAKTLHPQRRVDDQGRVTISSWRATSLAETFFSEHAIVDSNLRTEFYKHLPGILTGIGIIGTFLGLIIGLDNFDLSGAGASAVNNQMSGTGNTLGGAGTSASNTSTINEQLKNLIDAVGHAFWISGGAIALAMVITGIEKSMVAARYKLVETLRELVDSLFQGGAGEEYLERLVEAAETSATQAAQIKSALVAELKEILTTLSTQQIAAQAQHTGQMSADVGKVMGRMSADVGNAITQGLQAPMDAITEAVRKVGANQGDAVNRVLTEVLADFSARMREMFGDQFRGMSDLLRETSETMKATAQQFGQLAANMDAAGTQTVDAMGSKLTQALDSMERRQQAMNEQMAAFVDQIRALVAQSQSESSTRLQEALTAVGDQVAAVVASLRDQADAAAAAHGQRQQAFEVATGAAIHTLSEQMEKLLAQSVETNRSLQETVGKLAGATDKAMADMNAGAETLYVAASDFAKAGQGVADTMKAATAAVEAIKSASGQLTLATDGARGLFADYGRTRDAFSQMVTDLRQTVENARREAALTQDVIARFESAASGLSSAQKQAEEYLRGVSEVLVKAHDAFAENIERTLRAGNGQFQAELSSAVQLLSGAIKNLGDVVDELPPRR